MTFFCSSCCLLHVPRLFYPIVGTINTTTELEAFEGNEHTIGLAIPKLMIAFLSLDMELSGSETPLSRVKEGAALFVEISSHFLAIMRVQESESTFKHKPLRALSSVLEAAVVEFPGNILSRSVLEKHFPYSMIHSDNMDIALGKLKFGDKMDLALFDADDADK